MSSFITQRGLGLPKPSILERYTNILLVFTLSGILHVLTDIGAGRTTYFGTLLFFQSFTLGFAIEDAVQELWRRFFETTKPTRASESGTKTAKWKKVAGSIWTICFICVVAPWYGYPIVLTPLEERWILPYLFTEKLGAPATGLAVSLGAAILKVAFKPEI
jgi:peptidoglycan/LPS O-acetylase OafA/YrhL